MVEDKKNKEGKASKKLKATTGAWWRSTVVEDAPREAEADDKKEKKTAAPAKASRSRRSASKAEETASHSPEKTGDDNGKAAAKPRKRPARKKQPANEVVVAAPVAAPVAPVERPEASVDIEHHSLPSTSAVVQTDQAQTGVEPAGDAVSVAGSPVLTERVDVIADTAVAADGVGATGSAEPADSAAARRPPRKRAPRRKKPAVTDAGELGAEMVARQEDERPAPSAQGQPEQEEDGSEDGAATDTAAETTREKSRSASRGRSRRRKKPAAAQPETTEAAQVSDGETATDKEEDEIDERTSQNRRSGSSRRSRGRRRQESRVLESDDDLEENEDYDDDDIDDDDDFDDEIDDNRDDGLGRRGGALAELPDDDPEDNDREKIVLKLLINAEEPEECRLALLANGRLDSLHVSTINRAQTKNNIYKARIVAIEPNLQAAFVDYGLEKNGFLPFSEIHPEYYREDLSDELRTHVENHHWKRLSIVDVLEKGREVMVQVVKEEVGKKGANMTTYLSLPGRSVVLMPGSDSSGISRKISGEERRAQLRAAMGSLGIPEGIGWIVRTASADITKSALSRDVGYLLGLWEEIKKKAQEMNGVGQVYEDHQSVLRFLREHFDPAIEEILVDDEEAMDQVKKFISLLPSRQRDVKVRLHKGSRPIFNQFSVEDQIESIYQPRVSLPSGGSIVIEPTEALVSIDVNSGSTSKGKNFDQSIYQANLEAASELARQLRLRDLGGLVIVDFIDMRNKKHIREVERTVKRAMRRDKAKVDFSRISKFGLMQISRQKLGSPIEAGNYRVCQHCKGRGTVRSVETLALFYLRRIQTGASRKHIGRVECHFPLDVAQYLLNNKRHEIQDHESRYATEIVIFAEPEMGPTEHEILLQKAEKEVADKKQG
ncbi:MAG: ribonuclease E/G [Desulfopila sp.]